MGTASTQFLTSDSRFEVVGLIDRHDSTHPVSSLSIETNLEECIKRTKPNVVLIFSTGPSAGEFAVQAVEMGIPTVIGSSGVGEHHMQELANLSHMAPCVLVPTFSLGVVLMMPFAVMAAQHLPDAEMIELHHEKKVDSPSGTSKRTAELIAAARTSVPAESFDYQSRGIDIAGVLIHSVRLPGLLAHQEVICGGQGVALTTRHDSMDRSSFEAGIKLCCGRVHELKGFVVGMENLL